MLTNREMASLIIITLFIVFPFLFPSRRKKLLPQVRNLLSLCLTHPIPSVFLLTVLLSSASTALAWRIGLWDTSLLKDTFFITLAVVFPMVFRSYTFKSGGVLFKTVLAESMGLTALVAFYLDSAPLPLFWELVVQLLTVFAVMLHVVASHNPEHTSMKRALDIILGIIGVSLLAWATHSLFSRPTDWYELGRSLIFSFWLPLTLVPFFYFFGFYAVFDSSLAKFRALKRPLLLRVKLAIILGTRCRMSLLTSFGSRYNSIAEASTFREGMATMKAFRNDLKRRESDERKRINYLKSNSGRIGKGTDGAHLDRREFDVTKERLDWIWTCQNGRWEGNGGRYWDDLTDLIVDALKHGLPEDHGFIVECRDENSKWRAWRRTPGGAVLGVGGVEHRSMYYFQGDSSPKGWPGSSPEWIDATLEDWPPDWDQNDRTLL